jgi:hypothetical protein
MLRSFFWEAYFGEIPAISKILIFKEIGFPLLIGRIGLGTPSQQFFPPEEETQTTKLSRL